MSPVHRLLPIRIVLIYFFYDCIESLPDHITIILLCACFAEEHSMFLCLPLSFFGHYLPLFDLIALIPYQHQGHIFNDQMVLYFVLPCLHVFKRVSFTYIIAYYGSMGSVVISRRKGLVSFLPGSVP